MNPSGAVREYCRQCNGLSQWNREIVMACQGDKVMCGPCPFYPYRLGKRISVKVFRRFCLQCMGGDRQGVAECQSLSCPIRQYRYGTNPALKGKRQLPDVLRIMHEKARDVEKIRLDSTFISSESKELSGAQSIRLSAGERPSQWSPTNSLRERR